MRIERIFPSPDLEAWLRRDPVVAAYPLGYLDEEYQGFGQWFCAHDHGDISAVALMYRGLRVPILMTLGEADVCGRLIESVAKRSPLRIYAQVLEAHAPALRSIYDCKDLRRVVRMTRSADGGPLADASEHEVVQVSHADTADLIALYRHYPDAFFEPYQLESGLYYGIRQGETLVAVAGVHSISESLGIGVIGNIVTHPDYRRQGLSVVCTRHLLTKMFERVPLAALNVNVSNKAARKAFSRLGFVDNAVYLEGLVDRS